MTHCTCCCRVTLVNMSFSFILKLQFLELFKYIIELKYNFIQIENSCKCLAKYKISSLPFYFQYSLSFHPFFFFIILFLINLIHYHKIHKISHIILAYRQKNLTNRPTCPLNLYKNLTIESDIGPPRVSEYACVFGPL